MAKFAWQNVRLFTGGADLTTVNNNVEISAEVEEKETTAFVPSGAVWKEVIGGIRSTSLSASGQWEAGDAGKVDDVSFTDLGSVSSWTIAPAGAADGALAYLTGGMRRTYQLGGSVGDVAPWMAAASGNWPLARGVIAHPPGTARTATGSGTANLLTTVTSTQSLYAALHVLSVSGTATPTITVKVQSDDAIGFPSATDRITFNAATAIGGQVARVAGPITPDSYFRASWTISGTTPSFMFVVSFGIA